MNKIIIFSENRDIATSSIIQWIFFKGKIIERINRDDPNLSINTFNSEFISVGTSFGEIKLSKEDIYWFRRAEYFPVFDTKEKNKFDQEKADFGLRERKSIYESIIYWILNNCFSYGNPFYAKVSKIDVLEKAKNLDIKFPEWIITNRKIDLLAFLKKYKNIIVKTFNSLYFFEKEYYYKNLTNLLTYEEINKMPNDFETHFFQQYIDKKYELRIFYFDGDFFSMAILSQNDTQTKIDFRNYNNEKPNRNIPFILPKEYEIKLKELAHLLKIDTGSFDVLVDNFGNYYFLEVNPVGQFGMTSIPCNYYIEKYIAEKLIDKLNCIGK